MSPRTLGWRARFEQMVADLRANRKLTVKAKLAAPATPKQLAADARAFGRAIPPELLAFYRELNGFELEWSRRDDDDVRGCIDLRPIEEVFGDWKGRVWFDGSAAYRDVLPFDFFIAEACAAFRKTAAGPLEVHYHYMGEELFPTGYGFTDYLERLLESRGYWYWIKTLAAETRRSTEAREFAERAPELFPGLDLKRFRPHGADKPLTPDTVAAQIAALANEDDPPAELVDAIVDGGAPYARAVARLLDQPIQVRKNALSALAECGKAAASVAPLILRCHLDERDIAGRASSALSMLLPTRADRKQFAANELAAETNVHVLAVAEDMLPELGKADRKRISALAYAALRSDDWYTRYAAEQVLGALDERRATFDRLLAELTAATGAARAPILRALGRFYVGDADCDKQQIALVKKYLDDDDEAMQAASLGCLGYHGLANRAWDRLKKAAAKTSSDTMRIAALTSIACIDKKLYADAQKLLRSVADDKKASAAVRAAAEQGLR